MAGFAVVAVGAVVAAWAIPGPTVLAVQAAIPTVFICVGGTCVYCAIKAVARLVTGKYLSGRSDFGLPQVGGRRRRRLRSRE